MPASALFPTNQAQKTYLAAKLKEQYPAFRDGGWYYRKFLHQFIHGDAVVVDAGCGNGGIVREFAHRPRTLIGVDQDAALVKQNSIIHQKVVAPLEAMPLPDQSVDVITSEFVFEHLACPALVLQEFHRVLRPRGVVIFLTPNIVHPIMLLSKVLPYQFHRWFRQRVLRKPDLTHRTFYRLNTVSWLRFLGQQAGLHLEQLKTAGNPEYVGFARPLVTPSIAAEKIVNHPLLRWMNMYLIGYFRKA